MDYVISTWDPELNAQVDRPATPQEIIEIESRQTKKPTEEEYIIALEAMMDAKAAERRYANRITCALRAGYPGPFQGEGQAFALWMDNCNMVAYGVMAQVLSGQIPQPSIQELLNLMPELVWPPQVYELA